jgi:hypothetical protein
MAAFSLTTLRARVREKADMPVAGFIANTATSLDAFINEGIELLHDKLIEAYGADYVEKSASFISGTGDISLPSDFYKLLGVDLNLNGAVLTLEPYNRRERNTQKNAGTFGFYGTVPAYKLSSVGGVAGTAALRLLPAPATGTTGVVWYSPVATTLVLATDTVNFPAGWEKYVVIYAAMQCLAKEESDTRFLQGQLAMLDEKFKSIVENRDVGAPQHSVDVDNINTTNFLWWGR